MSAAERFRQAWEAKFPSELPPDLACLHVDPDQVRSERDAYGSVYGTVYSSLNAAAVEHTLQACNSTIAQLHLELERQQFVAEYLWEVLHGINSLSVVEPLPTPPAWTTSNKLSSRSSDYTAAVPLETDLSTAYGLDNIVPIVDSPSSGGFSPLSLDAVDGKVFPEKRTAGLVNTESEPVSGHDSKVTGKRQSVTRQHSLPLLDRKQNSEELESENERMLSLDSKPQNLTSVVDDESNVVTPANSFRNRHVMPSPSLSGQKAYRQKPIPTPRITVNKQAASASTVVHVAGSAVGESSTDDTASFSGNNSLQRSGVSSSFNKLSLKQPAESNTESVSSDDYDHEIRSVKERALAFTLSNANNTALSSVPGGVPVMKSADGDNLPAKDDDSPRQIGRRAQRAHVYEEVVPVEQDITDMDETGAVSSDDEEPLYLNLKILQERMLNRAKTFYSKGSQRPVAAHGEVTDTGITLQSRLNRLNEDDRHQLSGDSSKYLNDISLYRMLDAVGWAAGRASGL